MDEYPTRYCWFNPREWRYIAAHARALFRRATVLPGDVLWDIRRDVYWIVHRRGWGVPVAGMFVHAFGIEGARAAAGGVWKIPVRGGHQTMYALPEPLPRDIWLYR